jgi:hypothetical protein
MVVTFNYYNKFMDYTRESQRLVDSFQIHENKISILLSKIEGTYEKIKNKEYKHNLVWLNYYKQITADYDSADKPFKPLKKNDAE